MYYSGIDRHKRDSFITTFDSEGNVVLSFNTEYHTWKRTEENPIPPLHRPRRCLSKNAITRRTKSKRLASV